MIAVSVTDRQDNHPLMYKNRGLKNNQQISKHLPLPWYSPSRPITPTPNTKTTATVNFMAPSASYTSDVELFACRKVSLRIVVWYVVCWSALYPIMCLIWKNIDISFEFIMCSVLLKKYLKKNNLYTFQTCCISRINRNLWRLTQKINKTAFLSLHFHEVARGPAGEMFL